MTDNNKLMRSIEAEIVALCESGNLPADKFPNAKKFAAQQRIAQLAAKSSSGQSSLKAERRKARAATAKLMERIGLTPNIIQSLKTVEEMEALTKAASDSIGAEIAREVARALIDEVADKGDKAQQAKFLLAVDSTLKNMVREGKEVPRDLFRASRQGASTIIAAAKSSAAGAKFFCCNNNSTSSCSGNSILDNIGAALTSDSSIIGSLVSGDLTRVFDTLRQILGNFGTSDSLCLLDLVQGLTNGTNGCGAFDLSNLYCLVGPAIATQILRWLLCELGINLPFGVEAILFALVDKSDPFASLCNLINNFRNALPEATSNLTHLIGVIAAIGSVFFFDPSRLNCEGANLLQTNFTGGKQCLNRDDILETPIVEVTSTFFSSTLAILFARTICDELRCWSCGSDCCEATNPCASAVPTPCPSPPCPPEGSRKKWHCRPKNAYCCEDTTNFYGGCGSGVRCEVTPCIQYTWC